MTLEEVKELLAKEYQYPNWNAFFVNQPKSIDILSKRYAKAKLEEAAERATVKYDGTFNNPYRSIVNKESITQTPLD